MTKRYIVGWLLVQSLFLSVIPALAMGYAERAEFDAAGVTDLEVNASLFEVTVEATGSARVQVTATQIPRGFTVDHAQRRNSLQVYVRGRASIFGSITGQPRIRIQVPAGTDVAVETASGPVRVRGIRGEVQIESSSGVVVVDEVGGAISVKTSSGRASVSDCTGSATISTSSGGVTIDRFRGTVVVDTSSGAIQARNLQLTGAARLSTSSGNVTLSVRNDLRDLELDLATSSGTISVAGSTRTSPYRTAGRLPIVVSTSSGGILLDVDD